MNMNNCWQKSMAFNLHSYDNHKMFETPEKCIVIFPYFSFIHLFHPSLPRRFHLLYHFFVMRIKTSLLQFHIHFVWYSVFLTDYLTLLLLVYLLPLPFLPPPPPLPPSSPPSSPLLFISKLIGKISYSNLITCL